MFFMAALLKPCLITSSNQSTPLEINEIDTTPDLLKPVIFENMPDFLRLEIVDESLYGGAIIQDGHAILGSDLHRGRKLNDLGLIPLLADFLGRCSEDD